MVNDKKRFIKSNLYKKDMFIYVVLLIAGIISCMVRYPDFETTLWSASDTNYQCLMNAKAMLEAEEGTLSFLPLITFPEETDYGLEYSSGAFDQKTGKYFYYVSFPAFPFAALTLFLKLTGLAVNETSLYLLCSILFCISLLATVNLFLTIFDTRVPDRIVRCLPDGVDIGTLQRFGPHCGIGRRWVAFITGITYLCSVEIMHSQGFTYWGQNWYMVFFPILCVLFFKIERTKQPTGGVYCAFLVFGLLLLQTEWSGYFALFAFWSVSLFRLMRRREKKYLCLVVGMAVETVVSALTFVLVNAGLVGFSEFISVIMQRAEGRSRNAEYTIFAVESALVYSFGGMLLLLGIYFIWLVVSRTGSSRRIFPEKRYLSLLLIFGIPVLENHLFTNHALQYSMDRMKWYFILNFILLWIILRLIELKYAGLIIGYATTVVMGLSLYSYLYLENDYRWQDERLRASQKLQQYIETDYSDSVLGQLGNESVWGYSKILFGHGILKGTSIDQMIDRAAKFQKRYAVALNDLDLSYTQKWYSSAVIYDLLEQKYIITGSLCNQYLDRMNDLMYLQNAEYVDIFRDDHQDIAQRILFPEHSTMEEKEEMIEQFLRERDMEEEIVYFVAETREVPRLFTVQNVNKGEWSRGVSTYGNRLIFVKTEGNAALLDHASALCVDEIDARVVDIWSEGDFIYVDLETENILDFSYPNAISVRYEEN